MVDDLRFLPAEIRESARRFGNAEVGWPLGRARDAVNALAKAGFVVLGLDLREHDAEDRFLELAWSTYDPKEAAGGLNREQARMAAVFAVERAIEQYGAAPNVWIVVTWTHH